jgi:hypothetical protein
MFTVLRGAVCTAVANLNARLVGWRYSRPGGRPETGALCAELDVSVGRSARAYPAPSVTQTRGWTLAPARGPQLERATGRGRGDVAPRPRGALDFARGTSESGVLEPPPGRSSSSWAVGTNLNVTMLGPPSGSELRVRVNIVSHRRSDRPTWSRSCLWHTSARPGWASRPFLPNTSIQR